MTGSIGSAWVEVGADLSKLQSQMSGAVSTAAVEGQKIGASLSSGIGQGATAGGGYLDNLKAAFHNFSNTVSGISDETFGKWRRNLDDFGSSLQGIGTSLTIGVTAPLAALGIASVKAFGDIDALKRGLIATAGSAAEAERQFAELREVARLPGLGLEEAVQGSINLQNFGFSARDAKEILLQFGNALATVGKGRVELDRVILQLGQMAGAGKILMNDLRPIITQVPQMAGVLRNLFGSIDPEEINARLESAGLSTQDFVRMVTAEFAKLPRVTGGLKNDLENLTDSMKIALADLGSAMAPIVSQLINIAVPAVEGLVAAFMSLPQPVQTAAIVMAGLAAAAGPMLIFFGSAARGVSDLIGLFVQLRGAAAVAGEVRAATGAIEGLAGASSAAGNAVGLLGKAMTALKWAGWVGAILTAVDVMRGAVDTTEEMEASLSRLEIQIDKTGVTAEQYALRVQTAFRRAAQEMGGGDMGLDRQQKAIRALEDALHSLGIAYERNGRSTAEYSQYLKDLYNQYRETGVVLSEGARDAIQRQDELRGALDRARKSVEELQAAQRSGVDVSDALKIAKQELKSAVDALNPALRETAAASSAASKGIEQAGASARQQIDAVKSLANAFVDLAQKAKATILESYADPSNMPGLTGTIRDLMDAVGETDIKIGNIRATLENGVVVLRGAGAAAKEAAEAKRDLAAATQQAAAGYEKLASSAGAASNAMASGNTPLPRFGLSDGLPSDLMGYIQGLIGANAFKGGLVGPEGHQLMGVLQNMGWERVWQGGTSGGAVERVETIQAAEQLRSMVAEFNALAEQYRALGLGNPGLPGGIGMSSNPYRQAEQTDFGALAESIRRLSDAVDDARSSNAAATQAAAQAAEVHLEQKRARVEDNRTVKQLTDDLWALIDAGRGSSQAAFDLRLRIQEMSGQQQQLSNAYRDTAKAVQGGASMLRDAAAVTAVAVNEVVRATSQARSFLGLSQTSVPGATAAPAPNIGSGSPGRSFIGTPYIMITTPVYLDGVKVGETFTNVLRNTTGVS